MAVDPNIEANEASEVETQRLRDLAKTRECFDAINDESLAQRFGPDTYGMHELLDRVHLLNSNWQDFVIDHASCQLYADLYAEAFRIGELISRFYQSVGRKDSEAASET